MRHDPDTLLDDCDLMEREDYTSLQDDRESTGLHLDNPDELADPLDLI